MVKRRRKIAANNSCHTPTKPPLVVHVAGGWIEALAAEPALSALAGCQAECPIWVQTSAVDVFANHPAVDRVFYEEVSYPENTEHRSITCLAAQSNSLVQSIIDAAEALDVALNRVAPRLYLSAAAIISARRLHTRHRGDRGGGRARVVVVPDATTNWNDGCTTFWQSLIAALAKKADREIVSFGRSFSLAAYGGPLPSVPYGFAAAVSGAEIWMTDSTILALAAGASGVPGILVSGNPFLDTVFPTVLRIEQPEDPAILVEQIGHIIGRNTKLLSKS